MAERRVKKVLAGVEDLALGFSQVTQSRNGVNVPVTEMSVSTLAEAITFGTGATLENETQSLRWSIADGGDGRDYYWQGTFPKEVPAGSTPESAGGVGENAWRATGFYQTQTVVVEQKASTVNANNGIVTLPFTYTPGQNQVRVSVNGVRLSLGIGGDGIEYVEQSSTTVEILVTLDEDPEDIVTIEANAILSDAQGSGINARAVDFDDSNTNAKGGNVQLFNEDLDAKVADNEAFTLRNRVAARPYAVSDAQYSWWARPMAMRHITDLYNRTYQTFTEANGAVGIIVHDHDLGTTERYILDTDRVPDDHNAGCVCVGQGKVVCTFGGRSNTTAPVDQCLICEWDIDETPNGNSFNKYYLDVGRDYPNMYYYENDAILFVSQRGANGLTSGHSYRLNTWPLDENQWTAKTDLLDPVNSPDWTYVTSRRRQSNPSIIDLAVGFHPENQANANIYVAQIRHVGGNEPWRLYVNGSEIANISTGVGLPVVPSDFELAYSAGGTEKTRLFDIKDDGLVFASYLGTDSDAGIYKYAYKSAGLWSSVDIADTGASFYVSSSYFGGAALSENPGQLTIAQAINGFYRFKNFSSINNGTAWVEIDEYQVSGQSGSHIIHGRPLPENASLETMERGEQYNYVMTGWVGRFNNDDFTDFNTVVMTITPWKSNVSLNPWNANTLAIAAKPTDMKGFLQASVASINGSFVRERSGDFASSGIDSITRNSAAVGSRNITFTGNVAASGLSDTWIQGTLGANESTIGKNYSGIIGSDNCTITVGDSDNVIANIIGGSGNSSTASNSSYAAIMGSFGASLDCDFGFMGGTEGSSLSVSGNGTAAAIGTFNYTGSDSRTIGAGVSESTASGPGAGVYNGQYCDNSGPNSVVLASRAVANTLNNQLVMGYNAGTTSSTANRKVTIDGQSGDITIAGTVTDNNTFADIAKMLANGEGVEIEPGYLLTLIGDKVYKTQEGEPIDAIVAATPAMVHNDTPFHWQGRYLKDKFGRVLYEDAEFIKWPSYLGSVEDAPYKDANGEPILPHNAKQFTQIVENKQIVNDYGTITVYAERNMVKWPECDMLQSDFDNLGVTEPGFAIKYTGSIEKENPDYDPTLENTSRRSRPDEWTCAGVHGLIRTRLNSTATQQAVDDAAAQRRNLYIEPSAELGIGKVTNNKTNVQLMAVESEYSLEDGYAVGLCLLRG